MKPTKAATPISTPIPTVTNLWHRYIIGPTKTTKAANNNSLLLQRLEKQGLFKLNGKGNGIMLLESLFKGTTRSKNKGYHRGYNQAIMEIVDNIDKNSKCDREKARKIQSLQSKIHKALKSGNMSLYKSTTKQDWINYST